MNKLAIMGARLIDGKGADPLSDSLVLIEGDQIAWIGLASNPPAELEEFEVLDGKGLTLLPGLINCHVHLGTDPRPDFLAAATGTTVAMAALRAVRNARLSLEAGITTVRDMGSKGGAVLDLVKAIAQGIVPGPRIVAAGSAICMTGGHGWINGREADGADEVRKAAREQIKAGAAVVKLMATGGVMTPGIEAGVTGLSEAEMAAGIEEAHNAGRRTAAHCIGTQGIKNALRAGIDSVEHGAMLDQEGLDLLQARNVYLVPTLTAVKQIVSHADKGEMDEYVTRKARMVHDRHCASVRMAIGAGIRIGAGTDAGTPYNPHGNLAQELELLVESGYTPMQALRAATGVAADLLGLAGQIGTIEVSKQADLILVEGNPLADVGTVRKVRTVFKGGRIAVQHDPGLAEAGLAGAEVVVA